MTPIQDPDLAKDLQEILSTMLSDNRQAWELQPNGSYIQRYPKDGEPERSSQKMLTEMAQQASAIS